MSGRNLARRAAVGLTFEGTDITRDINQSLVSLTYTDNEKDEVDSLSLVIDDRDWIWLTAWLNRQPGPNMTGLGDGKGARLTATITRANWRSDGGDDVLDCGSFEVYSVAPSGPPATITIKAGSVPFSSSLRTEKKTKAWENYKLSGIAGEMAGKAGMTSLFLAGDDPQYQRREQVQQSDLAFLQALCRDAGISLKATAGAVVLFDGAEYEQKEPVLTLERLKGAYERYSFHTSLHDTAYTKCTVSYTDPKTGKTYKGAFTAPDAAKNASGQTLSIRDEAVYSDGEAKKLAQKRLREKNSQEFTASFTLPGDTRLVAGVTIQLKDWGAFSGSYLVYQAVHKISGGGYTVTVDCRRALEGY